MSSLAANVFCRSAVVSVWLEIPVLETENESTHRRSLINAINKQFMPFSKYTNNDVSRVQNNQFLEL